MLIREAPWNPAVHLGSRPDLMAGERLMARGKYLWLAVAKSWPSTYRIGVPLPLLMWLNLYVTDQRLIINNVLLGVAHAQFSIWYSAPPTPEHDLLTGIAVGTGWFGVPYVQIDSRTEKKPPFRQKELRIRIFTSAAGTIFDLVNQVREPFT